MICYFFALKSKTSSSHFETDFGVSIAFGDGNTKICFLKARQQRAFKKQILIIRIANPKLCFGF
jgi:hypothetical protein